jgi:hypothetical protein
MYEKNQHKTDSIDVTLVPAASSTPATETTPGSTKPSSSVLSASIDQNSLTSNSGTVTLTGKASNVSTIDVGVIFSAPGKSFGSVNIGKSNIPVVNGVWSVTLSSVEPGSYSVQVGVYDPAYTSTYDFHMLATGTLVVRDTNTSQTISVPSMSQFTDSNFGFSFWYPSNLQVQLKSGLSSQDAQLEYGSGTSVAWSVAAPAFTIDEVVSPAMSVLSAAGAGPLNSPTDRFYFDPSAHTWMQVDDGGPKGGSGGTTPADVSNNTMGGLHIFPGYLRFGLRVIVPLSATHFLVINSTCSGAGDVDCGSASDPHSPASQFYAAVNTILATDPLVATPVSAAQQTATIQAEAAAYAGQ